MKITYLVKYLLAALLLCLATLQVNAANVSDGFDATRTGDFEGALEFWQQRAKSGDAQAQFNLALMYHGGLGVEADEAEALKWYQKAAANDSDWAQEYLAVAYQEGWFGLDRNHKKSKFWYKKLTQKGF